VCMFSGVVLAVAAEDLAISLLAELVELKKSFEDQRKRVAELRAARKFKPY